MEITMKKLVELLNRDLMLEYSAAIQYIQHAIILADQIDFLDGVPTVDVGEIKISPDNVTMLEQDLEGEEDAIRRYKIRIEQAEQLKEFALAQQLRTILATEQEHAMDLTQALGK